MPSENTTKVSLPTKPTESRWLAIANLPETATEDSIKDCFKRHGRVQSVKINEQGFAFVAYLDIRMASKAHNSENILDEQLLRTAFHDGSNSVPKALFEPPSSTSSNALPEQPSPLTPTTITEPSLSSSSNTSNTTITTTTAAAATVTNSLPTKAMNGERDKRPSRTLGSPDENVRHQVVPVKHDSDSSGSKRKTSSTNMSKSTSNSHSTKEKPPRRKHDNSSSSSSSSSSSESDRSSDDSISCKSHRRHSNKTRSTPVNDSVGRTKILKVYHLPKMTKESLRESLWKLFVDFKEKGRLLKVQIDGEHETRFALLTFQKPEHVDKALTFAITKNLNGTRLKAEPYDGIMNETDECDLMKRPICTDPDIDEYSMKATRTLYIGNLQSEISYNELREAYSAYGDIIEVEIKRQTQSPHQLPFAFVQYADIKSVVKAMKASEPKLLRDHPIKLGFGKSQPTNVLWLDELPSNVSESSLRNFILRQTNLPTEQVLDIYIDNRNHHKTQTAQCLIYFTDTRAAQEAINLIRGKKLELKRIQVDFASKVFVTRFSDIIDEASQKKNYVGYPPDASYHGDSRSVSKRNGTGREILPETIQSFDTSSTRPNSSDRWSNAYGNTGRSQHKSDSRHSSDRRHSKEYAKGTNSSLISIPSIDNGSLPGASVGTRRHRLSTSSKDSLSNNVSSGRNRRSRHHASSTSESSSRSSSSSSHSSISTTSLEHRSNSYQKRHSSKHSQKLAKKQNKSSAATAATSNKISSGKKSTSTTKEQSVKSTHRSRSNKSEKDTDVLTNIPNSDANLVCNSALDEQIEPSKKESSPQPTKQQQQQQQQQTSIIQPSSSPKAPLKDNERIFDWLMQNQLHDSNSSTGLDQNEDDEHHLKRKPDDDSLENISDEQTSKTSPPRQTNNPSSHTKISSMSLTKNCKNEKPLPTTAAYRLQPIRAGGKRDEQTDTNSITNENHLSPTHSTSNVNKDEIDPNVNHRRLPKVKYHLSTSHTKTIPLESDVSYDQLDVRLRSYPSLFNDHIESIRLPFPQFAFENIKTSSTSARVLVVLNPKAHLKHSSLGLNTPSSTTTTTVPHKLDSLIDLNLPTNTDEDPSATRITLEERIRLLDQQMNEMKHGQQKSATSSSSSSSSSLSPATLIEQQNQKTNSIFVPTTTTPSVANLNTTVKSTNDLVSTLSPASSAKIAQCLQVARAAVMNTQSSPSKSAVTPSTTSPFSFPTASVPSLNLTRTLSTTSPSPVTIPSVLTPPPLPFPNLSTLPNPSSTSILTTFQAAITQTQMAAAAKYNPMSFAATLHPPPPPVPASLISPSLNLNSPSATTSTLTTSSHNNNNNNNNNNLMSNLTLPPPPTPPPLTLSNTNSTPVNLLSPPISNIPSNTSFSEPLPTSPSTSSAKILERLGPSAKFKRKAIPPPLAVVTTPTTPNVKDSSVLPSPEPTAPINSGTNSPPVLQTQLSNSSTGLKSILKQRSLSNSSSLSPTSERKSSTNFISPRTSTDTRPNVPVTPTTPVNRSASIDSTSKRTPPSTPTPTTEKKKPANQQDSSVFTNDVDERQADDKKSTWRTPPTKQQLSSNEVANVKKPILDKIPKKSTATSVPLKSTPAVDTTKSAVKTTKPTKPNTVATPIGSKIPQLTLERIDTKSIKPSVETPTKTNNKTVKVKRTNVLQSDSDTDKKSTSNDAQKTKKSLLNNEITKRKQQHQQKPIPTKKTTTTPKQTSKPAAKVVRKRSTTETHSSTSDVDEKKIEHPLTTTTTTTTTDQEQDSSDEDSVKIKKRKKTVSKSKAKSSKNSTIWKDIGKGASMYDRIKKRQRNEQTRNSSLSASEGHLTDENSDTHDDDDDDDDEDDYKRTKNRRANVTSRRNFTINTSDSESEPPSKSKAKKELVFDNNIFDAEESDEKSKPINRKSKVNQTPPVQQTKKPVLKTNNEQIKKDKSSKVIEEQSMTKKKTASIPKVVEKKKPLVNATKPIPKLSKSSTPAQKRPSTDESNESNKKQKVNDEQQSEVHTVDKPSIVISSPKTDSSIILQKIDEPKTETTPQTTPTKFGIVFPSHHRHSTTTPSSKRTLSTETPTSHETSKNDSEDHESASTKINKNDQSNANTLKPPVVAQSALSDDETLNPETMQLSDLIGGSRREDTSPATGRAAGKTTGKGKRATKQDTAANKRQQAKTNAKAVKSNEKQDEVSAAEPAAAAAIPTTSTKRPSTTETSSASSPITDKDAKRLRKSTDDSTTISQIRIEPVEKHSQIINTLIKEEKTESVSSSTTTTTTTKTFDQPPPPPVISMETDQVSLPSTSITTTTTTSSSIPLVSITSPETENAIKAVYSTISIPQQTISKTPNLEKSTPIIAPISKETLPIVEHQPTPTPIQTTSILPPHVSIKSSLAPSALNENVEETLSAVNSLLMLNNNPANLSGDHPSMKGAARVTPTISKPVYSVVTSLPSPTNQQTRQTPVTTSVSTSTTQQNDLITMVSNIVSSSNINADKPSTTTTTTTSANTSSRSHIEEVIDDVAKGALTTSVPATTTTTPLISEPITSIVHDVMRTPCLTSSTTAPTTTTTTVGTETLNIFDTHRHSTSPLKTSTTTTTPATTTTTTAASASVNPVAPAVVRPTSSKTSTSHKRSATPKTDVPTPTTSTTASPILHGFPHMLTPNGGIFTAGHHSTIPFSIFNSLPSNIPNSSGNPSLVSSSPPLATRTSSNRSNSPSTNSHITVNPLLNTMTSGQQKSTSSNSQTHEKASRREPSNKGSTTSSSSSNRSTPIQQTVPVPIPLTIPSSIASSASAATANSVISQQQQQASPLLNSIDAATVAAMRQQASPLSQFLPPDAVVQFRSIYPDAPELFGAPSGLYQPGNMAYAAVAQQMLTAMSMPGSHPSAAALAELYSNADSYFRINAPPPPPPPNEVSRDPYNVQWQGNLILKNDQAYVKTQLVAGSPHIARASMNYWNSDSLPAAAAANLQTPSHHNLRISQRMRLEQAQLEGVQKRMQMDNDHCILIAEPNGSTPDEIRMQQNNLKNGVIRYFDEKKAAGIVNVLLPGASQPAYVVHIFPPCQFASEILQKRAPDTYRCVVQNKIEQIYLLIVITSTVQ